MTELMIETVGLTKTFGEVTALDDVSIQATRGTVLGLLGHNGAGKSTLINILATLQPATAGTARVAGFDVRTQSRDVRRRIGLTGQYASVDEQLSGMDNLILIARLLGAGRRDARTRGAELIEAFDLADAAHRPVGTYSGGMRRRLDIAVSLVGLPHVIFLDEPTTGLDPVSRNGVWAMVKTLVHSGTTVLLTTQYLEEADHLADEIAVLSRGRIVAAGRPEELKARIGHLTAHVTVVEADRVPVALDALSRIGLDPRHDAERAEISAAVEDPTGLAAVVRALDDAKVPLTKVALTEPTLDDVYLSLSDESAVRAAA